MLEEAETLYPQDVEISYYLALAYFQKGEFSRAEEKFKKVAKLAPHYKDVDLYLKIKSLKKSTIEFKNIP